MAAADGQHWMGFNIYAFVKPTTPAEYKALLNEALSLVDQLNEQFDGIFAACAKAREEEDRKRLMPKTPLPLSFWMFGRRPGKPKAPAGAAAAALEFEH